MQSSFHLANAKNVILRFDEIIGREKWIRNIHNLLAHSKDKPFTDSYIRERFDVAIKLESCLDRLQTEEGITEEFIVSIGAEDTIRFVTQTLSLIEGCSPEQKFSLISRIRNSLSDSRALTAMQLELMVATNFAKRGFTVVWPELLSDYDDSRVYDILIPDFGKHGLEVECKAIMDDTGVHIKKQHARALYDEMTNEFSSNLASLKGGNSIIVKSPTGFTFLNSLEARRIFLNRVFRVIESGTSFEEDDAVTISMSTFDHRQIHESKVSIDSPEGVALISQITRVPSGTTCIWASSIGAIIISFQGTNSQKFEKAVFGTAKEAVKKQLSGQRPGIIVVGVPFSADKVREVAGVTINGGGFNPLARIANDLLRGPDREHLSTVCFVSQDEAFIDGPNSVQKQASIYFFPNRQCRFGAIDVQQIFGTSMSAPKR